MTVSRQALSVLFVVTGCASVRGPAKSPAPGPGAAAPPAVTLEPPEPVPGMVPAGAPVVRVATPSDGPSRGPATAVVTIVEWSDFQCPFCGRAQTTLEQIRAAYPNDVRIVFRHDPLPFHEQAPLAAQAAIAAEAQGKFWEMHDQLFANQRELERPALEKYAAAIGLDLAKFRAALDSQTGKARVDADVARADALGIRGTPQFFVDGRSIRGAQPFPVFKEIIDDELARAHDLIQRGVPAARVYPTLLAGAVPKIPEPSGARPTVLRIPIDGAPARGGAAPKVTIVEFADFQDPRAAEAESAVAATLAAYGPDVAVVFRHHPDPEHANALLAALAVEAAGAQGKFWEMHDKLLDPRAELTRPALEKDAAELGLDVAAFRAALDAQTGKARVRRDFEDAERLGAHDGTAFFFNGRSLAIQPSAAAFKRVVDEEIPQADALLSKGTPRAQLYDALTQTGLDQPPPAPGPSIADLESEPRRPVEVAGAPARGPADAPITIVEWSDFQCRYCARAEVTLARLREDYPDKIRFVWRDLPLKIHPQAGSAALAARVARQQGKFWAMHDHLFSDRFEPLDRASFERDATELGLNVGRFRAALDAHHNQVGLDADADAARRLGVTGTPVFFINGKPVHGAFPYETFKALVDAELDTAAKRVAAGTPPGQVYAALMKEATLPPPPEAHDDGESDPAADPTVYPVHVGNGPSKGPADAPLTLVIFSDFQCPFCQRFEPTLAELQAHYGDKLRVVWKNFPLPFHANASIAAEAALAADAQGKFWPMHDLMFKNQQSLDRASLESYAAAIGLDLARFKADLDSHRFLAAIDADRVDAAAVGVTGTPTLFLNGRRVVGAYPSDTFERIGDDELAKRTAKHPGKAGAHKARARD